MTHTNDQGGFKDRVIQVNRTSKKTSGGNKIGFGVLVVVGNGAGQVGAGLGKAKDVMSGARKAVIAAKKRMITITLHEDRTIQHRVLLKYGAARIMLKPAPKGSGIIAGGTVRAVLELAGIKDVVGKMLGSRNKVANIYATIEALKMLRPSRKTV